MRQLYRQLELGLVHRRLPLPRGQGAWLDLNDDRVVRVPAELVLTDWETALRLVRLALSAGT